MEKEGARRDKGWMVFGRGIRRECLSQSGAKHKDCVLVEKRKQPSDRVLLDPTAMTIAYVACLPISISFLCFFFLFLFSLISFICLYK